VQRDTLQHCSLLEPVPRDPTNVVSAAAPSALATLGLLGGLLWSEDDARPVCGGDASALACPPQTLRRLRVAPSLAAGKSLAVANVVKAKRDR